MNENYSFINHALKAFYNEVLVAFISGRCVWTLHNRLLLGQQLLDRIDDALSKHLQKRRRWILLEKAGLQCRTPFQQRQHRHRSAAAHKSAVFPTFRSAQSRVEWISHHANGKSSADVTENNDDDFISILASHNTHWRVFASFVQRGRRLQHRRIGWTKAWVEESRN